MTTIYSASTIDRMYADYIGDGLGEVNDNFNWREFMGALIAANFISYDTQREEFLMEYDPDDEERQSLFWSLVAEHDVS